MTKPEARNVQLRRDYLIRHLNFVIFSSFGHSDFVIRHSDFVA